MSELIKREDAINAVELFFKDSYIEDADVHCADMVYEIDHIPTASQWHRVEEALPEKDEWVLTITKSYKGARIYNIATVDSDGRWWTPSQNGMREIHYIEYWMPIEPPKEEKK